MPENKPKKLPVFETLDDLISFFETNDMGNYLDEMTEAEFEVNMNRETILLTLETETARKLDEIAKSRQTTTPNLVEVWLKEKISENS